MVVSTAKQLSFNNAHRLFHPSTLAISYTAQNKEERKENELVNFKKSSKIIDTDFGRRHETCFSISGTYIGPYRCICCTNWRLVHLYFFNFFKYIFGSWSLNHGQLDNKYISIEITNDSRTFFPRIKPTSYKYRPDNALKEH